MLVVIGVAALHYMALCLGAAGLALRITGLSEALHGNTLRRVFLGDNIWGVAAVIWIVSGLMRAFAGLEKGGDYYISNPWFYAKMSLFTLVFALEIYSMQTLLRWRMKRLTEVAKNDIPVLHRMRLLSYLELALLPLIIIAASFMARG